MVLIDRVFLVDIELEELVVTVALVIFVPIPNC